MKTQKLFSLVTIVPILSLSSNYLYAAPEDAANFTPSSVVIPITEITLRNGDSGGSPLYSCTGSLAECGVDITDSTALTALSASASIATGTYDRIAVGTCRNEGNYDATITGTTIITGTTYYTTTPTIPGESDVLSTNSTDLGPVTVNYSGCSNEYLLNSPITVAEGDSIVVNLFVNLENIAWAKSDNSSSIPSGCQNNSGGNNTQVVCMAYPDVVASIGTASPTVQTYHVSVEGSPKKVGQFVLLFNEDGSPLGGFTRPFYNELPLNDPSGFDTPLRTFSSNGDGTYTLGNYGSSATSYDRLITDFIPATTPGGVVTGVHDALSPRTPIDSYSATLQ